MTSDPDVRKVTATGSTELGRLRSTDGSDAIPRKSLPPTANRSTAHIVEIVTIQRLINDWS